MIKMTILQKKIESPGRFSWLLIIPIQITKTFTINMVITAGPLSRHSCSVFITLLFPGLCHSTFCYIFWSFLFNLCIPHKTFFPCLFSAQFFRLYLFRWSRRFLFYFSRQLQQSSATKVSLLVGTGPLLRMVLVITIIDDFIVIITMKFVASSRVLSTRLSLKDFHQNENWKSFSS